MCQNMREGLSSFANSRNPQCYPRTPTLFQANNDAHIGLFPSNPIDVRALLGACFDVYNRNVHVSQTPFVALLGIIFVLPGLVSLR